MRWQLERRLRAVLAGFVVLGAGVARTAAESFDTGAWRHRQDFVLETSGVVSVALPLPVLDRGRPGLPDLRVLGPDGREVPYVLALPTVPAPMRHDVKNIRIQLERQATRITFASDTTAALQAVELVTTARDFIKAARVETSADGEQWQVWRDGIPLVRENGQGGTTVPLGGVRAAHLRITLDDWRTAPAPISGAALVLEPADDDRTELLEAVTMQGQEFAGETVLTLVLPARNVPVAEIDFLVRDRWFSRPVTVKHRALQEGESTERTLARGEIARLAESAANERVRFRVDATVPTREVLVHVANADDDPLAIERVEVRWRPVEVVLHAPALGRYALLIGNPHAPAPSYDLRRVVRELAAVPAARAEFAPMQRNAAHVADDPLADAPRGVRLGVAGWRFHRPVRIAEPGVQELELDLDVLARAQSGLGDLRLVADEHQVPYLVERPALRRRLALTAVPLTEAVKPGCSRWALALPEPGAPISRLVITSPSRLFSRTLSVFEEISDRRGATVRRQLAAPREWRATPTEPARPLTIELTNSPRSDRLLIETQDGDNPPIVLGPCHAEYPVVRLLFRADEEPMQLVYGHDAMRAPRYDLALVAPHFVDAERRVARLGVGQPVASGASPVFLLCVKGGVLLWGALGLVVVVLLVVIARMLPRAPQTGPGADEDRPGKP